MCQVSTLDFCSFPDCFLSEEIDYIYHVFTAMIGEIKMQTLLLHGCNTTVSQETTKPVVHMSICGC